jgi:hypothetical protein
MERWDLFRPLQFPDLRLVRFEGLSQQWLWRMLSGKHLYQTAKVSHHLLTGPESSLRSRQFSQHFMEPPKYVHKSPSIDTEPDLANTRKKQWSCETEQDMLLMTHAGSCLDFCLTLVFVYTMRQLATTVTRCPCQWSWSLSWKDLEGITSTYNITFMSTVLHLQISVIPTSRCI